MFYIVKKIVMTIACYVDICAIWAWLSELKPEVYIAMASVVIAVIALWANIREGEETRKHNRITVRPKLERNLFLVAKKDADGGNQRLNCKLIIVNCGIGPAFVKKFEFLFEGIAVSCNNYGDYLDRLSKEIKDAKGILIGKIGFIPPGRVIKEGELILMWEFELAVKEDDIELVNKLGVRLEYQSIYEEETFICDTEESRRLASGEELL